MSFRPGYFGTVLGNGSKYGLREGECMKLFDRRTPLEKEWEALLRREEKYISGREGAKEGRLDTFLRDKVPEGLKSTLDSAFLKAFSLIFEKGVGIIEKTYNAEERKKTFAVDNYEDEVRQSRKTLRRFRRRADAAGALNLAVSGTAGIGMGLFGVGLPDIPFFTAMLLRNIYGIAMSYGYDYRSAEDEYFILMVIEGAVAVGEDARRMDSDINRYIEQKALPDRATRESQLKRSAAALSGELLYTKFLQGVPIVGAAGGVYDAIYMRNIGEYAKLKYNRRFLFEKLESRKAKSIADI